MRRYDHRPTPRFPPAREGRKEQPTSSSGFLNIAVNGYVLGTMSSGTVSRLILKAIEQQVDFRFEDGAIARIRDGDL